MTRQTWIIAIVVLGSIVVAAYRLNSAGARQRLGVPGVRVVDEPMYAHDGLSTNEPVLVGTNRVYLPPRVLDYASISASISPITSDTLPDDTVFGHRIYTNGFRFIDTQVVLMGSDRSSIHRPQGCLQGTGWQTISSEKEMVRTQGASPHDLSVRKLKLRRQVQMADGKVGTQGGVFVYWFVADNQLTSSHSERMWWMARDLLTQGVLQRWAYVICYTSCEPGKEDEAFQELKRFISVAAPDFVIPIGKQAERADAGTN